MKPTWIIEPNVFQENEEKLRSIIKSSYSEILKHEITHAFDPKVAIRKNRRNSLIEQGNQKEVERIDSKDEFLQEHEFDAYSRQITDFITKNISDKNTKEMREWLRSPLPSNFPSFLQTYFYIIYLWKNSKPTFFRRLVSRISNDCPLGGKNGK